MTCYLKCSPKTCSCEAERKIKFTDVYERAKSEQTFKSYRSATTYPTGHDGQPFRDF